jgi:uncharacterized protein
MAIAVERDPGMGSQTENGQPERAISIADPAPLGFAGLAMTLFVLSMFNAGLVSTTGEPVVLGLAVAYGGVVQLLAGMWDFRRGNTFGALMFSSYAAFWLSFWVLNQFLLRQIPTAEAGAAVGLYLVAWAIFSATLWGASLRTTAAISLTLLLLTATFVLLGIGNAGTHPDVVKIGGWFGLATAAAAWYASAAALINSTFGRRVLPVVPLRR